MQLDNVKISLGASSILKWQPLIRCIDISRSGNNYMHAVMILIHYK